MGAQVTLLSLFCFTQQTSHHPLLQKFPEDRRLNVACVEWRGHKHLYVSSAHTKEMITDPGEGHYPHSRAPTRKWWTLLRAFSNFVVA